MKKIKHNRLVHFDHTMRRRRNICSSKLQTFFFFYSTKNVGHPTGVGSVAKGEHGEGPVNGGVGVQKLSDRLSPVNCDIEQSAPGAAA